MFKRRNLFSALLTLAMLLSLMAVSAPAAFAAEELTEWEQASNIFATDETDEQLYEQALEEEGAITLYSVSSRCTKVAEAFMAKYEGLECVAFDISNTELLEKVTREHESGVDTADVVHMKDQDGSLYKEYVENKIFYLYKPEDILSHVDESLTQTQTPMYVELTQLFYNTEVYPDGSPITNIWQLTEEQWKGKILMQNPLDNLTVGAWATGFCTGEGPDQLAAAYEELYGEAIELSDGCENAGYEFLKRLHDNAPVFVSSADEVVEAVGTPGQSDPPVGFAASSKLRKVADNGWVLAAVNLYPTNGIPGVSNLYVVEGSEHTAGAKLLIRFMLGGIDGDLTAYDQFNTLGAWPVRDDIEAAEGSIPYDELNLTTFDPDAIYYDYNTVRDFWQQLG